MKVMEAKPLAFLYLSTNHSILCGGALIHRRHVIAPASCVPDEIALIKYAVLFRTLRLDRPGRRIVDKSAITHPCVNIAILLVSFSTQNPTLRTLIMNFNFVSVE